ncbi:hypothetical protein G6F35_018603 [Rhizopus arrhizus]|nr:hypothetical protein G6F35_018603 [Rhizopus arrhizus]
MFTRCEKLSTGTPLRSQTPRSRHPGAGPPLARQLGTFCESILSLNLVWKAVRLPDRPSPLSNSRPNSDEVLLSGFSCELPSSGMVPCAPRPMIPSVIRLMSGVL